MKKTFSQTKMLNFMRIMAIISEQIYIYIDILSYIYQNRTPHLIRHGSFEKKRQKWRQKAPNLLEIRILGFLMRWIIWACVTQIFHFCFAVCLSSFSVLVTRDIGPGFLPGYMCSVFHLFPSKYVTGWWKLTICVIFSSFFFQNRSIFFQNRSFYTNSTVVSSNI